jgi:signal transduction histidine kinase
MSKSSSPSFRRILLARILLLSIPVLLMGEFMVYRKARSGVLTTARYNLMESSARKADELEAITEMMRSNLLISSQLSIARSVQPGTAQTFVQQVKSWLPKQVMCVQLTTATGALVGSTCGQTAIAPEALEQLEKFRQSASMQRSDVLISPAPNPRISPSSTSTQEQLQLIFSAPVYDADGRLIYVLNAQASLQQQQFGSSLSRQGYTVVIDEKGVILAHPIGDRIGKRITQPPNSPVLEYVLKSAIAGDRDSLHLFEENREEWLAGYAAVSVPIGGGQYQNWVILAIAPIGNVLYEIRGIQQVLLLLTLGLLAAAVLATLFMTRDLARPLEQLSQYALQIRDRDSYPEIPKHFKIRELNQLADAIEVMIQRLDERAEELETAWREAQFSNQLKSEFLATTSHELRTPLNAIIGNVRLVKDGCCDSPAEVMECLQQADDAAIHLLEIIRDLLDISKIEVGQIDLNIQPVDVTLLCDQCLRWVQPLAERKKLDISTNIAPHLPHVALDERRVRQMVINLLSNAVKFTPDGGFVELSAWLGDGAQLEQEHRIDRSPINPQTLYLCLEVQDSGIGIDRKHWHLLFRPFQQIDGSSTRNYEGTGLGLALTKRLVELHSGTLSFDSTPGQGSVFRLWLPASELPEAGDDKAKKAT